MIIRDYKSNDLAQVVALWQAADLLRNPLNIPEKDIQMCLDSGHGAVLIGEEDGDILATAMVGHDGHRGWIYYVATKPELGHKGLGREIMAAAEAWLKDRTLPKVQLLVRQSNPTVIGFYQRLGYHSDPAFLLSKRLDGQSLELAQQSNQDPVVITYLTMKTKPEQEPRLPKVAGYKLERVENCSVRFYRYLYDAVGRAWFWTDRKQYSDQQLSDLLNDPATDVFVVYLDGAPAGFFELNRREMPVIDLAYFGIIEDYIGKGLGPWLLQRAINEAWSHGPKEFTVNTCTLDHPSALPMYQGAGFDPIATKIVPAPWQDPDNVLDYA